MVHLDSVGLSDLEGTFNPVKTSSLKNAPSNSPTLLFWRRIIRMLTSDSPTIGVLDYPVTLFFFYFLVALVQLVGLSKYTVFFTVT